MYSLDINFLKDRKLDIQLSDAFVKKKPGQPIGTQLPLIIGGVIMVLLPAATGGTLLLLNGKKAATEQAVAQLEAEISRLQGQNSQISEKQKKLDYLKSQTAAFVSVFNSIKPWSALLQDVRDRIPPNMQVDSIQQSEIKPAEVKEKTTAQKGDKGEEKPAEEPSTMPIMRLSFRGTANSYDQVNDFILSLQKSPFLNPEQIKLESSRLVDNPYELVLPEDMPKNKVVTLPKVVSYLIVAEINNTPASQLTAALKQTGAVGLISRLQTLEQKGAIPR
jgi:type IV pilus assembly protein PilN